MQKCLGHRPVQLSQAPRCINLPTQLQLDLASQPFFESYFFTLDPYPRDLVAEMETTSLYADYVKMDELKSLLRNLFGQGNYLIIVRSLPPIACLRLYY